jgi:hypothetical protein
MSHMVSLVYYEIWDFHIFFVWYRICCMPSRNAPYKGTYVPYDGTYGVSDQGQMLDV